ncbi:ste7-like protein [Lentinula detonsa]|uniref:Ste7-like protein n=1 Tax=Lentinula detonsa TaxID=2804962 RepID=A0AA38UWJ1_9AGAR|nr:ste7-like protein [Lentinula detonsa]
MAAPRALPIPPLLPATSPPPATPPRPALPTPPTASTDAIGNLGSLRKKRNFKALQLPTPPSPIFAAPGGPLPPLPLPSVAQSLVATRNAPDQPLPKRGLSIDVNNAQPHNTGLGLFGRGAALGSGLPPISASVLMTPESSTTQRLNLQAALTTTLEQMRLGSRPTGSGNSTLSSSGPATGSSGTSSTSSNTTVDGVRSAEVYRSKAERDRELIQAPLQDSDLKNIAELGMGNGGSVMKVEHLSSGIVMAKKIVLIDAKPSVRKQILRELHIMHACSSPFIVSSFGAYLSEPNICICMEFMDKGSFDSIYKSIGSRGKPGEAVTGPIPIGIVRQLAKRVLGGLVYLYEQMGVLHRDIKPSNILLNSEGEVKLCDFGVSGELENSVAKTFVGTSVYMSPERIQGSDYSVKSDVWSLGITLIELAHGCFPFADSEVDEETPIDSASLTPISSLPSSLSSAQRLSRRKSRGVSLHGGVGTLSILELMHHIVREPPPSLITSSVPHSLEFSEEAAQFVVYCLKKDPGERMNPRDLLGTSWMIDNGRADEMSLKTWAGTL